LSIAYVTVAVFHDEAPARRYSSRRRREPGVHVERRYDRIQGGGLSDVARAFVILGHFS